MTVATSIAETLLALNVRVVTHVPGFGGTESFAELNRLCETSFVTSFHEESAYGIAHGAAITGTRAALLVKSHGIAKAMNAVMDSLSAGVTAGLVAIIFEDHGGSHSDNIIEAEPLLRGAQMPCMAMERMDPAGSVVAAFARSEQLQLPVALLVDAEWVMQEASPLASPLASPSDGSGIGMPPSYARNVAQHLVCPIFAAHQRAMLLAKLRGQPRPEHPEPPAIPIGLPPAYQNAVAPYIPVFDAFREIPHNFVTGDAGVSTLSALPPYNIVSAASYMGGSIPLGIGALLSGMKHVWAFTGDFSFIAAGHYSLIEVIMRKLPLKVLLFANGKAQTTGGQPVDTTLLDVLLLGLQQYCRRIPSVRDTAHLREVLQEASDADELRIVIAEFN